MDVLAFSSEHKSSAYLQGKSKLMSVCPHFSPLYSTGGKKQNASSSSKPQLFFFYEHFLLNHLCIGSKEETSSSLEPKWKLLPHKDVVAAREKPTGGLSVSPRLLVRPKSPPESILLD